MPTSATQVLEFWFGDESDDALCAQGQAALWWSKNPALDREIQQKFGGLIEQALNGGLDDWAAQPTSALARVILLDQFCRNVFRGSAQAFAGDHLARSWADQAIQQGFDQLLRPIQRSFLYLPFEHSEDFSDQQRSCALFSALAKQATPAHQALFEGQLDFAQQHADIIERFARFPHRNEVLGRDSRAEELVFLQQPGSSF